MDVEEFIQKAEQDAEMKDFLRRVAEDAGQEVHLEQPGQYFTVTGVDILAAVVAYALYRWLKDYFDHRRAMNEVEVAKQQSGIMAGLIEDGFSPKDAQAVTKALLKRIAERNADDKVLQAAAGLLGKG